MKKLLCLAIGLTCCLAASAQTGVNLIDLLQAQRASYPLERVYVHTDSEDYLQGDRIWLKAYLMDELDHTPVDSTLYLYAELFDAEGTLLRQVRLLRRQGAFQGYLDIPEDLPSSTAYLRAYSRYMAAAPETAFVKCITVGRGKTGAAAMPSVEGNLDLKRQAHGFQLKYNAPEMCYLMVLRGGEVCHFGGIGRGRKVMIPDEALPDGPLVFLVVDREGKVVAENDHTLDRGFSRCSLPVVLDKERYAAGDSVQMKIDVSGLDAGELLDLSVSVTCRPLMARHHPASIAEYVLQRPSDFDFGNALKGQPTGRADKEATSVLSGTVHTELFNRPVKDARVILISPEAGILDMRQSGPDGRFSFEGLDFPAGTHYLVKSTDSEGNDKYDLLIDEWEAPAFKIPENPYATAPDDTLQVVYADDDSPFGTIALEGAGIAATVEGPPPTGFNRNSDYTITQRQMEQRGYTCLHELLREVPSVFIKEGRAYIRASVSINADVPAAIAIDGTIMDGEFDLDLIQMPDVARVDVFKTGQTVIWGTRGGGGVISVTTKTGDMDATLLDSNRTVHKKVAPLGYQRIADFATAKGYRNKRTVYWNPMLLSDSVGFRVGNIPGTYLIVLEGVSSDGRLIHEEKTFEVAL